MIDHAPSQERLEAVVGALEQTRLHLVGQHAETLRHGLLRLVRDYLLPRLADPTMTLVVAVAGPSGSGKSTMVNSMARRRVTPEGAVRPATRQPVAWSDGSVPGTLDALRARLPGRIVDWLRPPPEGLVVVDTPPPEIAGPSGRPVVADVLEVADACVFVAGPSRYADAESYELLERWADRGLPTVFVLNRLPESPELQLALTDDFALKLAGRDLLPRPDGELIVPIAEGPITPGTGGLPPEWVAGLTKELGALADPQARPRVVSAGVSAATGRLRRGAKSLRELAIENEATRVTALDAVRLAYASEAGRLEGMLREGALAGAGPTDMEMTSDLATVVTHSAGRAARRVAERWAAMDATTAIAEHSPGLFGHGPDTLEEARRRVEWWASDLPDLVSQIAGARPGRRRRNRIAEAVRRLALDPGSRPRRRTARFLRRNPGVVEAARHRLVDEFAGVLATDARRFEMLLGPPPPEGLLTTFGPGVT